jgi:hypothetical protein
MAALAAAQGPVFRSDTRIVEVAVVAKDSSDSPVTDLSKDELRLFDNGVEQTVRRLLSGTALVPYARCIHGHCG